MSLGRLRRHDRRPEVRQARLGVVGPVAPGPRRRQVRVELPARRLPRRDREALAPAPAVEHRRDRQRLHPLPQPRRRAHRRRRGGRERNAAQHHPGAADRSSLQELPSGEHNSPSVPEPPHHQGRRPVAQARSASRARVYIVAFGRCKCAHRRSTTITCGTALLSAEPAPAKAAQARGGGSRAWTRSRCHVGRIRAPRSTAV